jgi:hypothetical protein
MHAWGVSIAILHGGWLEKEHTLGMELHAQCMADASWGAAVTN